MRRVLLGAMAALLIAVLAAACGDDGGSSGPTTTSGPIDTTGATVIDVTFAGGSITGGGKRSVSLGKPVVIKVTSDVADEVHLHSYDLKTEVAPGTPGTMTFVANRPGIFEVELEKKGLRLFELEVK
jgi:hypothetical protein